MLSESLAQRGLPTLGGTTLNHMSLISLSDHKIDGARLDYLAEHVNITFNKNTLPGKKIQNILLRLTPL